MAACAYFAAVFAFAPARCVAQQNNAFPESAGATAARERTRDIDASQPVIVPEKLTFDDRVKIYKHSFLTPESIIGPVFGASISQMRDTPPEWGGKIDGFGKRVASGFARAAISRTIGFGIGAVDGEDPRYFRSNESGVWRRTKYAIASTFVSRRSGGGSMPAYSRFVGTYSAAFIANAWEPQSQQGTGHALERGSTAMLSSVGFHVFEEFWPDIRHAFHKSHE